MFNRGIYNTLKMKIEERYNSTSHSYKSANIKLCFTSYSFIIKLA